MTNARDTPQERMSEYGRLFDHALIGRERTSVGLTFRFEARSWRWRRSRIHSSTPGRDNGEIIWLIATDGDPVAESILD
jgi:hypothetical protein